MFLSVMNWMMMGMSEGLTPMLMSLTTVMVGSSRSNAPHPVHGGGHHGGHAGLVQQLLHPVHHHHQQMLGPQWGLPIPFLPANWFIIHFLKNVSKIFE